MAWRIFGEQKGRTLNKYEPIPLKNARMATKRVAVRIDGNRDGVADARPTIALSEWLVARGHVVIPYLAAHMIRDREHLLSQGEQLDARSPCPIASDSIGGSAFVTVLRSRVSRNVFLGTPPAACFWPVRAPRVCRSHLFVYDS